MTRLLLLLVCVAGMACNKDEHQLKPLDYTLTYEVITTSGEWFGEYNDSTGKRIVTGSLPSGWRYTFKLKELPFDMFMSATTTCSCINSPTAPDVIVNFYSNGIIFKTEKNNWAKGVTSLDFQMQ
jgi:hypothetical protein